MYVQDLHIKRFQLQLTSRERICQEESQIVSTLKNANYNK